MFFEVIKILANDILRPGHVVNTHRKKLIFILSPLMASAVLILIGVITRSVVPISLSALIWLTPLFVIFTFTDRLMFWLNEFREGRLSYRHFAADPRLSEETKKQIESAWDIPIGFASALRALTLSLAIGVVDVFSSFMDADLSAIPKQIQITLAGSLISLAITAIDVSRGKSIRNPGFFLKIIAVIGALVFFRALLLIIAGLGGIEEYRPMKALLSNPLWFLFDENQGLILHWIARSDLVTVILMRAVFPFMFFALAMDMLRAPLTRDNVDSKNFAAALAIVCCWFTSQWLVFVIR